MASVFVVSDSYWRFGYGCVLFLAFVLIDMIAAY